MKLGITVLLACIVAGGLGWASWSILAQKASDDAPTIVSRRTPTTDETEFTRELVKRYPDRKKIRLSEFMPESSDFGVGLAGRGEHLVDFGDTEEKVITSLLKDLVCKSDLVVVGRPSSKAAHLSSDESFIYTEYKLLIDDIVFSKNPGLSAHDSIKLAWPGGKIRLENRNIEAIDFNFAQLSRDSTYLLFLTFAPNAKGYLPVGVESDFEVNSGLVKPHSPNRLSGKREGLVSNKFFARVRDVASACGGEGEVK